MENMVQFQPQEAVSLPDNFRKQLAVAVRSIQWSYAIFWSLSTTQPGVLEWVDGYYNGDIKTRKTVQAVELKADKIALQRSEQLRELYLSLLEGDIDQQAKRPSAALSPEDLSDAEWYFLVCMSFVFNPGQGLPGRAFTSNQTVWLSNAQYAESKVFSRSLLAKSASIQTVVCFPHLGGVIEIGVTEVIAEDPGLIQHVRASLLDISKPDCLETSSSAVHSTDDDKDQVCAKVDLDTSDAMTLDGVRELCSDINEDPSMDSLDDCSHGCEHNHQTEDSIKLEGLNGGASLVESWHFMDEDFSNGIQHQMTSSDCISEVFVHRDKALSSPKSENIMHHQLKELEEGNGTRLSSLDLGPDDDVHYKRTLSTVLRSSNQLMENWRLGTECRSSFVLWKNGRLGYATRGQGTKQCVLKKILIAVPLMYGAHSRGSDHDASQRTQLQCQESTFVTQSENDKFQVLKSMVPSVHETDKASALDHMIKYLKELEARVEELECCIDVVENEAKPAGKINLETTEQTSDNYETKRFDNTRKPMINKRKASDIDDEPVDAAAPNDGLPPTLEVKVSMKEEVIIEMRCPYREYILVDIMDEINNLALEAHSVQSSTLRGVLTLTLKSKFRGAAAVSAGVIRQALWKIASKS